MHAVWNVLLAGARDSQAFAAVVLLVGAIVGAPVAVFFWDFHAAVWPFLIATSFLELTYFALLAEHAEDLVDERRHRDNTASLLRRESRSA